MDLLINLLFALILLKIAYKDWKTKTIGNKDLILILLLVLIRYMSNDSLELKDALVGSFLVSTPMLLLAMLLGRSFGGGDIKLMFVSGLYLGSGAIIYAAMVGILLAGAYIVLYYKRHHLSRKSQIALGPFLVIGCILALFIS